MINIYSTVHRKHIRCYLVVKTLQNLPSSSRAWRQASNASCRVVFIDCSTAASHFGTFVGGKMPVQRTNSSPSGPIRQVASIFSTITTIAHMLHSIQIFLTTISVFALTNTFFESLMSSQFPLVLSFKDCSC